MDRFLIDGVSPKEELTELLNHNGIEYVTEQDEFRFVLSEDNRKWETVCRYTQRSVLIYGLFPFETDKTEETLRTVNEINGELTRGGIFLSENRAIMRTSADMFDAYSAYEAIARAIEYNAGAMVKFWHKLQTARADP